MQNEYLHVHLTVNGYNMSIQRDLLAQLKKYISKYPILAVTGPRQAGKTTLLRSTFKDYRYISLENPDIRSFALEDPNGFLQEYGDQVIFDEVQRVPQLFSYLQTLVDESGKMGQFVLSGSQSFELMEGITQSLAGRVGIFNLFAFDINELSRSSWMKDSIAEQLFYGFYPAIYDREIDPTQYLNDYMRTYVQRDIRRLQNIQDMDAFQRLVRVCASSVGQMVNYNHFSKIVGVSHTTIRHWISLLKSSFILFELPPYFNNFNKRLVKSPKLYFYDTGLVCRLLEISENELNPIHASWGSLFENLVIAEFVKQNAHLNLNRTFYYWRDSNGHEVDLLFREDSSYQLIEVKAGKTIKTELFKNLDYLDQLISNYTVRKILIYGGDANQQRSNYQIRSWRNIHNPAV